MIRIEESGLTFGPYKKTACYEIEHSEGHRSLGDGFKMVEFSYVNHVSNKLFLIEAKSTIPNPNNDKKKYDKYFDELYEKFENALLLHAMAILKRNSKAATELPQDFANIDWQTIKLQLRLVIPNIPKDKLSAITDKLRTRFLKIRKMWFINTLDIKVINQELAQREGLIE